MTAVIKQISSYIIKIGVTRESGFAQLALVNLPDICDTVDAVLFLLHLAIQPNLQAF